MEQDWFQEQRSDLFQSDFTPGRHIYEDIRKEVEQRISDIFFIPHELCKQAPQYVKDESNKNGWITVVYKTVFDASRAAKQLPEHGLNVYYPLTRHKSTHIEQYLTSLKGASDVDCKKFVPALGRYLLIQLPEDQETFEPLEISITFLEGLFNRNGVSEILAVDGNYSITPHREIVANKSFHELRNKNTDPDIVLRFKEGETVRISDGNLRGFNAILDVNVPMSYKLKNKVGVRVGKNGGVYQVRVAWLEKL